MNDALNILIELLKRFEGCRLKSYRDVRGVWTIGWGETLGVTGGMQWTQEQADTILRARAMYFLLQTVQACPQLAKESPVRIAACGSLAYNIGKGAFSVSSVCRFTGRKKYSDAKKSFKLWNKAAGKVIADLTWRRAQEAKYYGD